MNEKQPFLLGLYDSHSFAAVSEKRQSKMGTAAGTVTGKDIMYPSSETSVLSGSEDLT